MSVILGQYCMKKKSRKEILVSDECLTLITRLPHVEPVYQCIPRVDVLGNALVCFVSRNALGRCVQRNSTYQGYQVCYHEPCTHLLEPVYKRI